MRAKIPALSAVRIGSRIAICLVVGGAILAGDRAAAQFGNIFGDSPPRPPADVPQGGYQQPPPPPPSSQYPRQPLGYPAGPPPRQGTPAQSAIETQPLPPPPGATVAPVPRPGSVYPQQPGTPTQPAQAAPPANAPPANGSAPAATASPPPENDVVVEAPTPHIDNGRALFSGLDKVTGRTTSFYAAIGETVQFGALQVTPRACYTRPPTEATNTDAFVEVDEVTLKGQIKRIFTGWMFASSPGLNAVEHPIYDVWLTGCAAPLTKVAEPEASAARPQLQAPSRPGARPPPVRR